MKSLVPVYITNIGFILIALLCTAMLSVQVQISSARALHSACLNKLQSSNFQEAVVEQCKEHVKDKNSAWELEIAQDSVNNGRRTYLVTLDYDVVVPFIGINNVPGTVSAYAK